MERVILHCDLNNFYASVECLDRPELREVPMVVCGDESRRCGVVVAKNYPAKALGIATGDTVFQARQKCPQVVTLPPNFKKYRHYSREVRKIYARFTDLVEPFSLDECWLDVSGRLTTMASGVEIAGRLRRAVREELGLTISAGVSFNKVFAKLASDMKKPDATTLITQDTYRALVWPLPVRALLYVGPATESELSKLSIYTIGDLAQLPQSLARSSLGKTGEELWRYANGLENSPVTPPERQAAGNKSISHSLTLPRDVSTPEEARPVIYLMSDSLAAQLRAERLEARTVQVTAKTFDFVTIDRQGQLRRRSNLSSELAHRAMELLISGRMLLKPVRLLGLRVTDLEDEDGALQLSMLEDDGQRERQKALSRTLDALRARYGADAVTRGLLLDAEEWDDD